METICAISTPPGMGGIAVVRVSGADALQVVGRCWRGKSIEAMSSHTAHLGEIVGGDGCVIDTAVVTLFRGPHSFTGEDVVEISCHGSVWIQQAIVTALIEAGARLATGGEFTRRAFANGRMDLSQAEAVADLISAQSASAHRVAMNQMRGAFREQLSLLRQQLLRFVSLIELELDFSEEDVSFADRSELTALATDIHDVINNLAGSFRDGNVIKNGLPIAIVGPSNAGKSTLLNALLGEDRALVSDIKGTTRDVIEDTVVVAGTLLRFIDTAGIRNATDVIETMGIERSFRKMDEARIVLWVADACQPLSEVEQFFSHVREHCAGKAVVGVINKSDVATVGQINDIARFLADTACVNAVVTIAARVGKNVEALKEEILRQAALPAVSDASQVIVTNVRHYEALVHARESLERVLQGLDAGLSGDLLSQDIRECMHYLGEITGEITTHEILGEIFSRFCIGK